MKQSVGKSFLIRAFQSIRKTFLCPSEGYLRLSEAVLNFHVRYSTYLASQFLSAGRCCFGRRSFSAAPAWRFLNSVPLRLRSSTFCMVQRIAVWPSRTHISWPNVGTIAFSTVRFLPFSGNSSKARARRADLKKIKKKLSSDFSSAHLNANP